MSNPVNKLKKNYPETYKVFLKSVDNPKCERSKILAAAILSITGLQRLLKKARHDLNITIDSYGDEVSPLEEGMRMHYEDASQNYFRVYHQIISLGYPSDGPIIRD